MKVELYCQNCQECYDMQHIYRDISEKKRNYFLSGKGCEYCHDDSIRKSDEPEPTEEEIINVWGEDINKTSDAMMNLADQINSED